MTTRDTVEDVRATPRRHLTILISDLSKYTRLTGEVEPEYCLDVVNHLKACSKRVVGKYGGAVVDFTGDSVMAMFGFPQPSEHDGRRATEAALELHQAIRDFPESGVATGLPPLRLHTGVHSGLVLLVDNGPPSGQYVVIGEAPAVASRLSSIATDDEVLVSATTLGGESHFFELVERGELQLEGKIKPIAVIQVLRHSQASTRYEARKKRGLTPFVGRARELDMLAACLNDAINGSLCDVAVVAAAGVGKTRLIEQFLHKAALLPVQVCRGYCENYLGAEPLQPFLQMLREVARQEPGEISPEFQAALSLGLQSAPSNSRSADDAVDALCGLFAGIASRTPLILFIDDWQWADDATKQVVARMREKRLRSVFILTASREPPTDDGQRSQIRMLELAPFNRDEATEAILTLRPDADPPAADQIHALSGGNPLFIEELCHRTVHLVPDLLAERGDTLPAWLSTLIESRVGRLPSPQVELVRVAAVIGAVVPAWLLEQVTGRRADDPILDDLADNDLIYPGQLGGTFRFKHGITRDVIYASVGLRDREALHRKIAGLLEQRAAVDGVETLLEPLSYHFRAGAEPERAAHYAELAGDKALAASAPDRARSQYAAALTALDLLPSSDVIYGRWSRIVYRFGLACVFDPTRDQLQVFERAAVRARDRDDRSGMARAEYWIGFINYALGDQRESIDHYERARQHCVQARQAAEAAGDQEQAREMEALRVQLLATIGQARAAAGEFDVGLTLLDEALAVKRQHRRSASPAVGSSYALACKGAVLGYLGRFAEAYSCFEEALEAIRAGHSAVETSVVGWQSAMYLWQGRWQQARASAIRAQSLAQRVGSFYVFAMCQTVEAYATWMLERTPDSIDVIARATSWLEVRDKRLSISMNYGWLADVAAAMADAPNARRYAAWAIRRARLRDPLGVGTSYRALASLPWPGHGATPADYLDMAMRSALAQGSPRERAVTLLCQAQHVALSGDRSQAHDLATRARSEFLAMDMPWHVAAAEQCLTDSVAPL